MTAFALSQPPPPKTRAVTPIENTNGPGGSNKSETPEPFEPEDRWGIEFKCYIGPPVPAAPNQLTLLTKVGFIRYFHQFVSRNFSTNLSQFEQLKMKTNF